MEKTIFIPGSCNLKKLTDDYQLVNIKDTYARSMIDYCYMIPEDGIMCGKEVKAGDIVFYMYPIDGEKDNRECIICTGEHADIIRKKYELDKQESECIDCDDCDCEIQ